MLVEALILYLVLNSVIGRIVLSKTKLNIKLDQCISNILEDNFSEYREVTYVNINSDDQQLLRTIHKRASITLIARQANHHLSIHNKGYLITANDTDAFAKTFPDLVREAEWNPEAPFLVGIKEIKDEIGVVFDTLFKQRVINVLVVNGANLNMYTYNPFDNYACGRYYDRIINYGNCFRKTSLNLYPEKLVTGLRNCTFTAIAAHRPPFSKDPSIDSDKPVLAADEIILKYLSETEDFTVNISYTYKWQFTTIAPNMTVSGAMESLQNNSTEIVFGGIILTASRGEAFSYVTGFHDYIEELRFFVKRATVVSPWKNLYLAFHFFVWLSISLCLILYTILIVMLIGAEDKCDIILKLTRSLLLHGYSIRCRFSAKILILSWVWFAYLVNTFYQSSLVSIATNPISEYQIKNEDDLVKYHMKPCFANVILTYVVAETYESDNKGMNNCKGNTSNIIKKISVSDNLYTLMPYYVYLFTRQSLNDRWGRSPVYSFQKPYTKFIFGIFFYKGFPISHRLRLNAMRLRENGLTTKNLNDQWYAKGIKYHYSKKGYETRFVIPWNVYLVGCSVATLTFILELLLHILFLNLSPR